MSEIIIKARSDGRIFVADEDKLDISEGDVVLIETEQCQEVGKVMAHKCAPMTKSEENQVQIIRRLSQKDIEFDQDLQKQSKEKIVKCQDIVKKYNLPMELVDADLSFDEKKLTFYFSSPGRVDFRSLVSELASTFQKLIRLQQVGQRDRARCAGGIGRCGEEYCCARFLRGDLDNVDSEMANVQNLGQMGANRTTGACGKVMCCLRYELDHYREAKAKMPAMGSEMKTEKGKGIVISQNVLKNTVTVKVPEKGNVEVSC